MRIMYDSVNPTAIPRDAQMVAGYVNGPYKWKDTDWALFPHAVHVGIAVRAAYNGGEVLDVEIGDATPAQAPGWVQMRRAAGVDPSVYCNSSTWPEVRAAFSAAGVAAPHYWIAHYDGNPAIPNGAVAKQYQNTTGWDLSSVADYWPGIDTRKDTDMQQSDIIKFYDPNIPSGTNDAPNFNQYLSTVMGLLKELNAKVDALSPKTVNVSGTLTVSE